MSDLPRRKPNRLKAYDYSQNGAYFVTICAKDRHEIFGRIINGELVLNEYGMIVQDEIELIPKIRKECLIRYYVIMPNHIHLMVQIAAVGDDGNRSVDGNRTVDDVRADCHPPLRKTVSNMVQGFKGAVSRKIGYSIWQRSFHDHIVRNQDDYNRIAEYIENNPTRWEQDCFYGEVPK